jgi:glycosyltransferase involved in cell wall biosynthesis
MASRNLSILNIGLDRDLLALDKRTEAQERQRVYASGIPARLVHIVKASSDTPPEPVDIGAGVCVVPCPVSHWGQFLFAALGAGARQLRNGHFDLIQVQEPYLSGLAGALLSWRFGLPLVVGVFSDEVDNPVWLAERRLNRVANWVAKWVLGRAAAIRVDSRSVVERISGRGYRNLAYVPVLITGADRLLAPSAEARPVRPRLLGSRSGPLLLAVCRLEPEKNISLMLRAVGRAAKSLPGLVLAVAGDGRMAAALAAEAAEVAPGCVHWLGRIENADLAAYYHAADLLLLSSNRESAARVLWESLLAGTPVLTTDTAGAREVVEDGISGCIVPIGDLKAFGDALAELCRNVDHLARLGAEGQRRVERIATAEAVLDGLRQLYDRALQRA